MFSVLKLYAKSWLLSSNVLNYYYYSESPKTKSLGTDPFGFFWKDTSGSRYNIKWIYHNCHNGTLTLLKKVTDQPSSSGYITLSNLTFYNIKPKTRTLEDVQSHLLKTLSTCEQFDKYLKNHKNILDGYIYFFDTRLGKDLNYLAMKVNLYGPEDIREKQYLLRYTEINSKNKGFVPLKPVQFFVSCQTNLFSSGRLIYESDSDSKKTFFIELKNLLFYDEPQAESGETYIDGHKAIEMKVLHKKSG